MTAFSRLRVDDVSLATFVYHNYKDIAVRRICKSKRPKHEGMNGLLRAGGASVFLVKVM